MNKRLHWETKANNAEICFYYRIIRNDCPYAMSPGMVHLVVWLKTPISIDAEGDQTTESSRLIAKFIERTSALHMR